MGIWWKSTAVVVKAAVLARDSGVPELESDQPTEMEWVLLLFCFVLDRSFNLLNITGTRACHLLPLQTSRDTVYNRKSGCFRSKHRLG